METVDQAIEEEQSVEQGVGHSVEHGEERVGEPLVLTREEHTISRRLIDPDALKVLYRLHNHGYKAYLVGGGVRDLLLGRKPKDFDVGTDARPEQIRSLFRNSRVIGRRFRLNHVYFYGNKIVEVSTFRANATVEEDEEPTMLRNDNEFGDAESDSRRRDLTINGLFYDIGTYSVIDYVGGIRDLESGIVRMIGEPSVRFKEDPVRMIRAIRHAARLGFQIDPVTYQAICDSHALIRQCSTARVFEEFVRELRGGNAVASLGLMEQTGLLQDLMPELGAALERRGEEVRPHLNEVLRRIDIAAKHGDELSAAVLFLALSFDSFSPDQLADARHIESYLDELFLPVGVSRKERELMAQVLTVRNIVLKSSAGAAKSSGAVAERHGFSEALDLIMLTANETVRERVMARWGEHLSDAPRSKRSQPRNRRRNQHRRRP